TDDEIWADSAYFSKAVQAALYWMGFISHIHERAYRNRPLSQEQEANNTERSRTRSKVEHVFGTMITSMGGKAIRSIGITQAKVNLGLKNLTFNLQRYVFWQKQELIEAIS
ncbi:MAG: transposase, partial [Cyanobacteria bacterium J06576_12]